MSERTYVGPAGNAVSRQRAEQIRHPERRAARWTVHNAVLAGAIPSARSLICIDCGKQAAEYDHYLGYEPEHRLDVQPVCVRCHWSRGKVRGHRVERAS